MTRIVLKREGLVPYSGRMPKIVANHERVGLLRTKLLDWYDRNRRDLPWRRTRDPYAIWISEIMLQQTRVAVVVERFQDFMRRFPTVFALANAPEEAILAVWSGLGYYRRARMLHKAAQAVVTVNQGVMPKDATGLRALPGVGGYTAAAVASIAYNEPIAAVDGNVERVLCRIAGWAANGGHERKVEELASRVVDEKRPGDFNQAMMELGATVCMPRNPQCLVCPIAEACKTRGEHKTAKPVRAVVREVGHALCLKSTGTDDEGDETEVLLEQRPANMTVMPGLWELPALRETPNGNGRMTVRHAIMNVNYIVHIHRVEEEQLRELTLKSGERRWVQLREAETMALTGLTRKVLKRVKGPVTVSAR